MVVTKLCRAEGSEGSSAATFELNAQSVTDRILSIPHGNGPGLDGRQILCWFSYEVQKPSEVLVERGRRCTKTRSWIISFLHIQGHQPRSISIIKYATTHHKPRHTCLERRSNQKTSSSHSYSSLTVPNRDGLAALLRRTLFRSCSSSSSAANTVTFSP